MMTHPRSNRLIQAVAACIAIVLSAASAQAVVTTVGSGSGIAGATNVDGAGVRLNVDRVNTATPFAGTFQVNEASFSYTSTGGGVVTPFLAELTGPGRTYEVIWVGSTTPASGSGIHTETFDSSDGVFALDGSTEVFAGIHHDGTAKVRYNNVATLTDYDNGFAAPTLGAILADADFSNKGLNNRTYAFDVSFDAAEAQLGAGSDFPGTTGFDTLDQPRLNIDRDFSFNLPAGDYLVTDLSFVYDNDEATGEVIPFIAELTGPNRTYEIVWIGDSINPDVGQGTHVETFGRFDATFSLDSDAQLHAGIWHDGDARIGLVNNTTTLTDHDGGATPTMPMSVSQVIADADISNKGLPRTYQFEINVQSPLPVPEPASLSCVALAMLGLGARRRRRC